MTAAVMSYQIAVHLKAIGCQGLTHCQGSRHPRGYHLGFPLKSQSPFLTQGQQKLLDHEPTNVAGVAAGEGATLAAAILQNLSQST